jgi:hypothetical protein
MAHAFFTIEQGTPPKRGVKPAWVPLRSAHHERLECGVIDRFGREMVKAH